MNYNSKKVKYIISIIIFNILYNKKSVKDYFIIKKISYIFTNYLILLSQK